LVEFSNYGIPQQMTDCLFRLMDCGITPIITHPEGYAALSRHLDRVLQWVEEGCIVQITASSSLTGNWRELARAAAYWLLDRDAVHVLATDAHDTVRRPPVLSAAHDVAARAYNPDRRGHLVEDNPRAIVAGRDLP
jgi:protein-tyrosine phosphatase